MKMTRAKAVLAQYRAALAKSKAKAEIRALWMQLCDLVDAEHIDIVPVYPKCGHPWIKENHHIHNGKRHGCLECHRTRAREYQRRRLGIRDPLTRALSKPHAWRSMNEASFQRRKANADRSNAHGAR